MNIHGSLFVYRLVLVASGNRLESLEKSQADGKVVSSPQD